MDSMKWRFPAANYGDVKGENTGDKELFKKDSYVSLGREIMQNSIDQRYSDEEPVRVEFEEFSMKTSKIPGIEDYKAQIRRCIKFWNSDEKYKENYEKILDLLEKPEIDCLKISDYNTTGLLGIQSEDVTADRPYIALVKGTGVSKKKNDYAGGSKGVGKNVPFILSDLVMVFYVTKTIEGYCGSIGVTKLVAGYVEDDCDPKGDYTQGTGYYGVSHRNEPIADYLKLDKNFIRDKECGTDVYIIGFKKNENWLNDVISSVLDSFLVAIYSNELVVSFNGYEISKDNLEDAIQSNYINAKTKKSILAQYQIMKNYNGRVKTYDIETELGNALMYIMPYSKAEEANATRKCAMIRTPKMFIKNYDLNFNVSAMIIIDKNTLGEKLREIENAQHIDWEPKRIKDISERREVENAIDSIKKQMHQHVLECLKLGNDEPIDPNSASEYLPEEQGGESTGGQKYEIDDEDEAESEKVREKEYHDDNPSSESEEPDSVQPVIGDIEPDEEGDESLPGGHNEGGGGEAHPGEETGTVKEGDNEIVVKANLKGVRYKVVSTNKKEGKVRVIFISPVNSSKAYITLSMLDDNNNSIILDIKEINANGKALVNYDQKNAGPFELIKNQKNIIDIKTDMNDFFASEVKITYESR